MQEPEADSRGQTMFYDISVICKFVFFLGTLVSPIDLLVSYDYQNGVRKVLNNCVLINN